MMIRRLSAYEGGARTVNQRDACGERTGRRRWLVASVAVVAAVLALVVAEPASSAGLSSLEAETMNSPSGSQAFSDDAASGGQAMLLYENGRASARFAGAVDRIVVRARGDMCDGAPHMVVEVDGVQLSHVVSTTYWADYSADIALPAGDHNITLSFTNDHATAGCDRNLRIDGINILSDDQPPQSPLPLPGGNLYTASHEAESFALLEIGQAQVNTNASGGQELYAWSDGTARKTLALDEPTTEVIVRARAQLCGAEAPKVDIKVDGTAVGSVSVTSTSYEDYSFSADLPVGLHTVDIVYTNDHHGSCDRNVLIDKITFAGSAGGSGSADGSNSLAGQQLYVNPDTRARHTADAWYSQGRTADARQLEKIASAPTAVWFGGWNYDVRAEVDRYVTLATNGGGLPVLVTYNIPLRDCDSYSAGGASSAAEYRSWIRAFAEGIGDRKAAVIVEPDAIPDWDCITAAAREERRQLITYAIEVLQAKPGIVTYVDAGHWQTPEEISRRLQSVGIDRADGFSLNVSNFQSTSGMIAYGNDVSSRIGGKHFVIDTGRNGLGPYGYDHSGNCAPQFNPPGRALGPKPTTNTGHTLVDAYLWVKYPGDSDANCGGFPPAGTWMPEYALNLAQRAAY